MIDTREELTLALGIAAELEHSLLIQYLFAAFTCRSVPSQQALMDQGDSAWLFHDHVRGVQAELYRISREEMAHLGTVANLLTAIGAPPHFARPPLETVRSKLLSAPSAKFTLAPLSLDALDRFRQFEAPEPAEATDPVSPASGGFPPNAAPDSIEFHSVGGLYRQIRIGFSVLYERLGSRLFVGAPRDQHGTDWDAGLQLHEVTDLLSAHAAIDYIIAEGEGTAGSVQSSTNSHFARMARMRRRLSSISRRSPNLHGYVWPVVSDPSTAAVDACVSSQTAPPFKLSPGSLASSCAELSNATYTLALTLLAQLYDPAGESPAQRRAIRDASKQLMSAIFRPICEVLVSLPVEASSLINAGPPFEVYGSIRLPARVRDRKNILLEQVEHLRAVCLHLDQQDRRLARLQYVAENFRLLRTNLDNAFAVPS